MSFIAGLVDATHICLQNLGLEEVGVKMTENGAIEVVTGFFSFRFFCISC